LFEDTRLFDQRLAAIDAIDADAAHEGTLFGDEIRNGENSN